MAVPSWFLGRYSAVSEGFLGDWEAVVRTMGLQTDMIKGHAAMATAQVRERARCDERSGRLCDAWRWAG